MNESVNNKRFYWVKLKEDFFDDDTISFVEEQPQGVEYINFYLKLCLKSIKNDCRLIRCVGETILPYDLLSLSKLTKVDIDIVRNAMELFVKIGLISILENGEFFLNQIKEMVGSETDKASVMRKKRLLEKLNNSNNVTEMLPECYSDVTPILDNRDKSIDVKNTDNKEKVTAKNLSESFNSFWEIYPKKIGKAQAEKSWAKIKPSEVLTARILDAVRKNITDNAQWKKDAGQFIPYPATWLNQERWTDSLEEIVFNQPQNYDPNAGSDRKSKIDGLEEFLKEEYGDEWEKHML